MQNIQKENSSQNNNDQGYRAPFSTPKKSQQDIIFAFRTSQRKQSISESRQKIMNSVQIQNAKIDQFMGFIFKLRKDPSDLNYNQIVEFFNNEKEHLNIFAQSITRGILIEEIEDDSQPEVINKILLFMINLELFEDELNLVKALFIIFEKYKDQECHINCLRVLKGIFKRNTTLAKKMEEYLTKGFFINILLLNENSPKILKLVSQVCLVLMREHVSYDLQAFKSKIVKIFIKAIETKDLKVIHGILFLLNSLDCETIETIIDEYSEQLYQICKEKLDQRDYDACDSLFSIILFCSHNSLDNYQYLRKYLEFLYEIDDTNLGYKVIVMLLYELGDISLGGISQNEVLAIPYLNILFNILIWPYYNIPLFYDIKIRIKTMLELIRIRLQVYELEDGELEIQTIILLQIDEHQNENPRLERIGYVFQSLYQLL